MFNAEEMHNLVGRMLARAIEADAPAAVIASLADWRRRTREAKRREPLLIRVRAKRPPAA